MENKKVFTLKSYAGGPTDYIPVLRKVLEEMANDIDDDCGFYAYEEDYKLTGAMHILTLSYFYPSSLLHVGKRWGQEIEKLK